METKKGRPRKYALLPPEGFRNAELALASSALLELSERVADQIADLPPEALGFPAGQPGLSIGWLAMHMIWAETVWVDRGTGCSLPGELTAAIKGAELAAYGNSPGEFTDAAAITSLFGRVRSQFSLPALRGVADIDREFESKGMTVNMRGIMAHLAWHWTYHSGQIGLIRLLWGSDYSWSFEKELVLHPVLN
jgi:uncharacterized damage-inducible protein DinB